MLLKNITFVLSNTNTNMNTMNNQTTQISERQVNEAMMSFCPFGYLDVKRAVEVAIQAGKDIDYVYDCVYEFSESTDMRIDQCDPVYCVMDAILQDARNEIEHKIGYDFINDGEGSIYTYGNFMASSYDYHQSDVNALKEKLSNVDIESLSDSTIFFLSELEIL